MGTIGVIYGIFDTDSPERIRYVGLTTNNIAARMRNHWTFARTGRGKTRIYCWLRKRIDTPYRVGIREIDRPKEGETLQDAEIRVIREFRGLGMADLNISDGGNGGLGHVKSPEVRKALSDKYRASGGPSAVLNWETVREIRRGRTERYSPADEVGNRVGVNRTAIDRILRNQLWYDPEFDPSTIAPRPPAMQARCAFTMEQVQEIRELRKKKWIRTRVLAEEYGVTEATMQHLLDNRTYKDPDFDPKSLAPTIRGKKGQE